MEVCCHVAGSANGNAHAQNATLAALPQISSFREHHREHHRKLLRSMFQVETASGILQAILYPQHVRNYSLRYFIHAIHSYPSETPLQAFMEGLLSQPAVVSYKVFTRSFRKTRHMCIYMRTHTHRFLCQKHPKTQNRVEKVALGLRLCDGPPLNAPRTGRQEVRGLQRLRVHGIGFRVYRV